MGVEIQMIGTTRSIEKREAKRYRYKGDATVRRLEYDESQNGRILDLSVRGCLLRLPDLSDLTIGALVDISLSSRLVSLRALGSVRHCSRSRKLLGIAFVNLSRRCEADLLELIDDLDSAEQMGSAAAPKIAILRHIEL
jgi:hypothetical protein